MNIRRTLVQIYYSEYFLAIVCLFPASLFVLVIGLAYPVSYSFFMSLSRYSLLRPWEGVTFIGLQNYLYAMSDPILIRSVSTTFLFAFLTISVSFVTGFGLALVLKRPFVGRSLCRSLFLIPYVIPGVVNALMWGWIFDGEFGIFNFILKALGIISTNQLWLGEPVSALLVVVLAKAFEMIPYTALILLAGLQTVPQALYDAAEVDGGSVVQKFRHITLPSMKPVIAVVLILITSWAFLTFDMVYALTGGGPYYSTSVMGFVAWQEAFQYLDIGYGSALAWIITAVTLTFTLLYMKIFAYGKET